jgi:hypothetical protein
LRNAIVTLFSLLTLSAMTVACDSNGNSETDTAADTATDTTTAESVPLPTLKTSCQDAGFTWLDDPSSYYPPDPSGVPNGPTFSQCAETCQTDADCTDSGRPFCAVQGLFEGGDYNCNGQIDVCRSTDADDCD